jgi:hypothetical protein
MSYPIVAQRNLTKPVRKGIIPGLTRPRRDDDEIPKINPHEVLVYRVGGQYVVDDGSKRPDDGQVINAINVSVVSMQQGAQVAATFEIDSMDASKFMIRANFVCSVLDPTTVVRNGLTDASEAILAYLNGYQALFELGLWHPISDVNAIRREASVHIKAYMTIKPPELAGVSVHFANVQVDTPATIAEHETKKREDELDFERKKLEARHRQELALQQHAATAKLRLAEQNTKEYLSANQQTHSLDRTRELNNAIEGDPIRAIAYAQVNGDLTAAEYMEQLLALAQQKEQRAVDAENRERSLREQLELRDQERLDKQLDWRHENVVREVDWNRRIELHQLELNERQALRDREYEDKDRVWKREDHIRELEFTQAEAAREAEEASERRREAREIELEMLKEFNKRGLLDNFYPDFDDLMSRIRGEEPAEKSGEKRDRRPIGGEEKLGITDGTEVAVDTDESDQDDASALLDENYDS